MNLSLTNIDEGLLINSERLNNIKHADNNVHFTDSLEGLQLLISRIVEESARLGLAFNIKEVNRWL